MLAITNTPFQLAFIVSFAVVIAPAHQLTAYAGTGLNFGWLLMATVVFHPQLNSLLDIINRLVIERPLLLAVCAARTKIRSEGTNPCIESMSGA